MTSARSCYCKQAGCALRQEDNDIGTRSENRRPATVVSRKSIVKSGGGSPGRARSVVGERKVSNLEFFYSSIYVWIRNFTVNDAPSLTY